jgi:leucyl aminopeptidase
MQVSATFSALSTLKTQCLIVPAFAGTNKGDAFTTLDKASKGAFTTTAKKLKSITDANNTAFLTEITTLSAQRILIVGMGKSSKVTAKNYAAAIASAIKAAKSAGATEVAIACDAESSFIKEAVIAAVETNYVFDECKSIKSTAKALTKCRFIMSDRKSVKTASKAAEHGLAIANGMSLAKTLGNLPGNICTPSYLADAASDLARGKRKLKTTVLSEAQMQKLGMGSLLSVSRGSRQPAKLIVMEYKGGKATQKPIALVGKGLTFDAGGISIKPGAGMDEMKYDMCGAASVFGAMQACVELELPINVVGVIPSSENLPDGDANKPGDIVTSMSGQTIEILNTDAEGRLILCDALTYTERFEPAAVIDIATLTGACIVALGDQASGLMANDDKLADELLEAGQSSGDRAWRLPIWDEYQSQLDSNFADMANIGGPKAGSITAACFLARYTKKFKWAHLDIAGTAWKQGAAKGATGRPVPLLMGFLMKRARVI